MKLRVRHDYLLEFYSLVRGPGVGLKALQRVWPALKRHIEHERARCISEMPSDDPLRVSGDLLGPLDKVRDERTHSRALGYLLDGSAGHDLGVRVLEALGQVIRGEGHKSEKRSTILQAIFALVGKNGTRIAVTPEHRFPVTEVQGRSVACCDLWLELKNRTDEALIVIENKIDSPVVREQLDVYEQKAKSWSKSRKGKYLLVLLTVESVTKPSSWINITYLDIASALRAVWCECDAGQTKNWLGFYIATIARELLEIDLRRPMSVAAADLQKYLGEKAA